MVVIDVQEGALWWLMTDGADPALSVQQLLLTLPGEPEAGERPASFAKDGAISEAEGDLGPLAVGSPALLIHPVPFLRPPTLSFGEGGILLHQLTVIAGRTQSLGLVDTIGMTVGGPGP